MKKITLFMSFALAIFLFSCGPSVEGEKEDWKANQTATEKLKTDYPAFATMIDTKWEAAKVAWAAAEGIKDEDDQAKKMSAANDMLDAGCIGNLRGMKSKISSVESKSRSVKTKKKSAKKGKSKAEDALDEAKDAIKYASKVLAKSSDELGEDPCGKINEAYRLLSTAHSDLSSAMTAMSAKKKTKKDKEKDKKGSKTDTKKEVKKDTKPAMKKCSYCDSKNAATKTKCGSCGANL